MLKYFNIKSIIYATLNSYAQIFFSQSKLMGFLILLASFIDVTAGFYGLLSVAIANGLAYFSGFSKINTQRGLYGFNALLVGLGIGFYYQPSIQLSLLIAFAAVFSILVTLAVEGVLYKYALPFLSIPFVFSIWTVFTAAENFEMLHLSERNIFVYNELYAIGGKRFTDAYHFLQSLECCSVFRTYLMSLGAIVFQPNVIAGGLLLVGLIHYSRIALSLSLLGFFAAFGFYSALGGDFTELSYNYIGFNYILTSVAVGGFFIIPSWRSYLWVVILLPITVIVAIASQNLLFQLGLGVYALPFNIVVLMFLYVMKIRLFTAKPQVNYTQQKSPEESLYFNKTHNLRFGHKGNIDLSLPFWGEWKVTQGYNGKHTHKGEWQHALDFEIVDSNQKLYQNSGNITKDYYCYEKSVLAPASGVVTEIIDGIPDNEIGQTNTKQNWGNSIIIKHDEYLYTQLSHLKEGSFTVKKGEHVKKSQVLAKVGNSGHSPYPHLHFQVQTAPILGAPTIYYPFENYIIADSNQTFGSGVPAQGEIVFKPSVNSMLRYAFSFVPGQRLSCSANSKSQAAWTIEKDAYNYDYLRCCETGARAYFVSADEHFYFTNFYGSKKSHLFEFFLAAYHLKYVFIKDLQYSDSVQINYSFPKLPMFFHDFIAPFYMLFNSNFLLTYEYYRETAVENHIKINTSITNTIGRKVFKQNTNSLTIDSGGRITVDNGNFAFEITKIQRT